MPVTARLRAPAKPGHALLHLSGDQPIYQADGSGPCWRIRQGAVRLSRRDGAGHAAFAGIARVGDILGSEVLVFGRYAFDAYPLGEVVLEPWLQADTGSLLRSLAAAERRTADALALRAGEAIERIRRLFMLLSDATESTAAPVFIPSLKEMAGITDLTEETVSRVISQLRRLGVLTRQSRNRGLIVLHALHKQSSLAA